MMRNSVLEGLRDRKLEDIQLDTLVIVFSRWVMLWEKSSAENKRSHVARHSKEFPAAEPAYENARSPNLDLSCGVSYDIDFHERSLERDALFAPIQTRLVMYAGQLPLLMVHSLYWIRNGTGNQCNWRLPNVNHMLRSRIRRTGQTCAWTKPDHLSHAGIQLQTTGCTPSSYVCLLYSLTDGPHGVDVFGSWRTTGCHQRTSVIAPRVHPGMSNGFLQNLADFSIHCTEMLQWAS